MDETSQNPATLRSKSIMYWRMVLIPFLIFFIAISLINVLVVTKAIDGLSSEVNHIASGENYILYKDGVSLRNFFEYIINLPYDSLLVLSFFPPAFFVLLITLVVFGLLVLVGIIGLIKEKRRNNLVQAKKPKFLFISTSIALLFGLFSLFLASYFVAKQNVHDLKLTEVMLQKTISQYRDHPDFNELFIKLNSQENVDSLLPKLNSRIGFDIEANYPLTPSHKSIESYCYKEDCAIKVWTKADNVPSLVQFIKNQPEVNDYYFSCSYPNHDGKMFINVKLGTISDNITSDIVINSKNICEDPYYSNWYARPYLIEIKI